MKTLSLVSTLRKASIALAITVFAAMPAWAGKYASIVVDLDTAKVLHARDADEVRYPASLTKVMTLYLVFDAIDAALELVDERGMCGLPPALVPAAASLRRMLGTPGQGYPYIVKKLNEKLGVTPDLLTLAKPIATASSGKGRSRNM